MKFLNFSSDSPNYKVIDGKMVWNVAPWTFEEDLEKIALSSCFIFFEKIQSYKPITLSCSLVDADYSNFDGIIAAGIPKAKALIRNPATLEFWKMDYSRPRIVTFTLKGIDAETVKLINITLALK